MILFIEKKLWNNINLFTTKFYFKPLAAAFIFLPKTCNNLRDLTHSEYYNNLVQYLEGGI